MKASGVVWLGVKLREEPLKIRTRYKYGRLTTINNSNYEYLNVRNNTDGKASLKRQKSPETTKDTQDLSKFYWFIEI